MIQFSQDLNSINVTAVVTDQHGNPATVFGPSFESDNDDLARVAGVNELTAVLEHGSRTVTGVAHLTFHAFADEAQTVSLIHAEDVNVPAGVPANIVFNAS